MSQRRQLRSLQASTLTHGPIIGGLASSVVFLRMYSNAFTPTRTDLAWPSKGGRRTNAFSKAGEGIDSQKPRNSVSAYVRVHVESLLGAHQEAIDAYFDQYPADFRAVGLKHLRKLIVDDQYREVFNSCKTCWRCRCRRFLDTDHRRSACAAVSIRCYESRQGTGRGTRQWPLVAHLAWIPRARARMR